MFHWVSNGNGNVEHLTDKKRIHNNVPLIDLWSFGCRDLISINKHKYLFLQQTLNFSKHFKFQSMSSNKLFQRIDRYWDFGFCLCPLYSVFSFKKII